MSLQGEAQASAVSGANDPASCSLKCRQGWEGAIQHREGAMLLTLGYLNLGTSGEEGGLETTVWFNLFSSPLLHPEGSWWEEDGAPWGRSEPCWDCIALAPAPSLGLSMSSSDPMGAAAKLLPVSGITHSPGRGEPWPASSLWAPRATPETSDRNNCWGPFPERSLSFLAQSGQSKT